MLKVGFYVNLKIVVIKYYKREVQTSALISHSPCRPFCVKVEFFNKYFFRHSDSYQSRPVAKGNHGQRNSSSASLRGRRAPSPPVRTEAGFRSTSKGGFAPPLQQLPFCSAPSPPESRWAELRPRSAPLHTPFPSSGPTG